MKTFKFSLVLHTRENTDVFITLDNNIYGIHSKRVNILYIFQETNICASMAAGSTLALVDTVLSGQVNYIRLMAE